MEETEERRLQREAIKQAKAEALAFRARSTNVLNIPEEAWVRARVAIQNNTDIPEDATRDELLAYNYLLRAHGRMMPNSRNLSTSESGKTTLQALIDICYRLEDRAPAPAEAALRIPYPEREGYYPKEQCEMWFETSART